MRASYLEIYNEEIRDLLGSDAKQRLEVSPCFLDKLNRLHCIRRSQMDYCSLVSTARAELFSAQYCTCCHGDLNAQLIP